MTILREFTPFQSVTKSKAARLLDAFFDPVNSDVRSFRECYRLITGDKRITGRIENCDQAWMREALDSSSWANVLGDSITRRMVAEYNRGSKYTVWRNIATIVGDIHDFRTQERVRFGGYGDLPSIAQGAPYASLASPPDERASYAVSKRGGTESITLEMIKNDDVRAIQALPKRLAEAAQRTLAHFVLDFLRTNPVIYDGVPLFDVAHANLGNAALSSVGLAAGRMAIRDQAELGSGDRLCIEPRFLWVSIDQEETAANLFRRSTNLDRTFIQDLSVEVVPVWYWTDPDDWCLSVDPANAPTIELAFLDGQEEPELIQQDGPTYGSLFSNDQFTWKIRHIYGGAVIDYRGIYKSVV